MTLFGRELRQLLLVGVLRHEEGPTSGTQPKPKAEVAHRCLQQGVATPAGQRVLKAHQRRSALIQI